MLLKLMLDEETTTALLASAECNQRPAAEQAIVLIRQALGMSPPASVAT